MCDKKHPALTNKMIQTILQFICSLSLFILGVFSIQGLDFVLQANVYLQYSGYSPSVYGIVLIAASLALLYTDLEMCFQSLFRVVDLQSNPSKSNCNRTTMTRRTLYEWKEFIMVLITFIPFLLFNRQRHNFMVWIILFLAAFLFVAKASGKAIKSGNLKFDKKDL